MKTFMKRTTAGLSFSLLKLVMISRELVSLILLSASA